MIFAVDIGGSSIKYGLVDDHNRLSGQGKRTDIFSDTMEFTHGICKLYEKYGENAEGVAISYCGELNPENGYAYCGGSLHYNTGKELRRILQEVLPVPVSIENDGNCATYAELYGGTLCGSRNAMVLVLGTGVGCGLVLNGSIFRGSHCAAGAPSLNTVNIRDFARPGEILSDAVGYMGLTVPFAKIKGWIPENTTGEMFFQYVAKGDCEANEILNKFSRTLANYIYNTQFLLDLEKVVIGGGISRQPVLIERIQEALEKSFDYARVIGAFINIPKIEISRFTADANLIGATEHFRLTRKAADV